MSGRALLSRRDVALLAGWLPYRSMLSGASPNARTLVSELCYDEPDRDLLRAHRAELDQCLRDFREGASWRDYTFPVGRGGTRLSLGGVKLAFPSSWEYLDAQQDALLSLESEREAHRSIDALALRLRSTHEECVLAALLCRPSLDEARALVSFACTHPALVSDPWVRWLAGRDDMPAGLSDAGDLARAIKHGIAGRWRRALSALPAKRQKPRTTVVKPAGEETMADQVASQIITHVTDAKPSAALVERSMITLFSHWPGAWSSSAHSSTRVRVRLPVVALYRAKFSPNVTPLEALHRLRAHNEHIRQPIDKRVVAPQEVLTALAALCAVVESADRRGVALSRSAVRDGYLFTA
jgi:hypothetical protein